MLLARVNSIADINHGAGQGEKLEENFFFVEGYNKRFFDEETAQKVFWSDWQLSGKKCSYEKI